MGTEDGERAKIMLAALTREHRTLQQSFWRTMFNLAQLYGQEQWFDLRNEASVETCKRLFPKPSDVPPLPFI
jgi:hypothetical protein